MDANDEDFLAVGPVEDSVPIPFRKIARGAPQELVLSSLSRSTV
jgi:hypothetical protein